MSGQTKLYVSCRMGGGGGEFKQADNTFNFYDKTTNLSDTTGELELIIIIYHTVTKLHTKKYMEVCYLLIIAIIILSFNYRIYSYISRWGLYTKWD